MFKLSTQQIRFLKRNEGLLILLGALIMSLTFVVDNVIREHLRSVAGAIAAAQATFLIRDSTIELYREIDEVDAHVVLGNKEILNRMPKPREQIRTTIDFETLLTRPDVRALRIQQETWNEFNNLGIFLEQVAPEDPRVSELNALYKEWDNLRLKALTPIAPIGDGKVSNSGAEASGQEDRRQYLQMLTIHGKLQMLGANILDDAHSNLAKNERLLSALAPLICFLFFIGVLLTVITRLAGIEGVESHGE